MLEAAGPVVGGSTNTLPADADNPIGTSHTVTATVLTGPFPVDGESVVFTVTGANPTSGSAITNSAGVATFTYTGALPGNDTITAFPDLDGDGVQDADETAVDTATKEWINLPPVCSAVVLDITTLWPPNHKLRTITASGATDPDIGGAVTLVIDGITQDEPVNGARRRQHRTRCLPDGSSVAAGAHPKGARGSA